MNIDMVRTNTMDIPFMLPLQGELLYRFLTLVKPKECLELGFLHGVSSCYIAAALHENGYGKLTTIDVNRSRNLIPNIHELLDRMGLNDFVSPICSDAGYNWELMRIIEAQTHNDTCVPIFDFCFLDGSHLWNIDGFAFYLVEKLLNPGGWLLFDDIEWTVKENYPCTDNNYLNNLSEEERVTAQVDKIFTLLVRQHPNIGFCAKRNEIIGWTWAWAQKKTENTPNIHHRLQPGDILEQVYRYDN